jgi:hypothetical protein
MAENPNVSSVSGALVARCCGISRQTHAVLIKSKTMPRPDVRQGYDLIASVTAFIAYRTDSGTSAMQAAKLKKTDAEGKLVAMKEARARGELMSAEMVAQAIMTVISAVKEGITSATHHAATAIPNISTTEKRLEILEDESCRVLLTVSALIEGLTQLPPMMPNIEDIPGDPNSWQGAGHAKKLEAYRATFPAGLSYDEILERHRANVAKGMKEYRERCARLGIRLRDDTGDGA